MMTLSTPMPSAVLKVATKLKIEEFERLRKDSESLHLDILTTVKEEGGNQRERVASLLEKIKNLGPEYEEDYELSNMEQYLKQAAYDQSISITKLGKFETALLNRFKQNKERMALGSLYAKLLTEWIEKSDTKDSVVTKLDGISMEDEFELVEEGELEQLRERFDSMAFSPLETNAEAIDEYLSKLFAGSQGSTDLENLRRSVSLCGEDLLDNKKTFTEENVTWTIKDLLRTTLVSAEKKETLNSYLQSPAVLKELISTLNLRYSNIASWKWRDAEKGLRVEARQNMDGAYCMTAEENLLDLIFLNIMAVRWSSSIKDSFRDLVNAFSPDPNGPRTWKRSELPSPGDFDKRDYYLGSTKKKSKPPVCMNCHHGPPPPPPQFAPPPPAWRGGPLPPPPPPPPPPGAPMVIINPPFIVNDRLDEERHHEYMRDLFLSRLPGRFRSRYGVRRFNDRAALPEIVSRSTTQEIITKKLATDMLVRQALDGEVGILQHDFKSFATGLSHCTILAVLKFVGVPEAWLSFFERFLEAPLNMGPIIRGTADQVRIRKRGVPVGHAFETFFGEVVLFFLDLAINQIGEVQYYRTRDEGWLCGKIEKIDEADRIVQEFVELMGLTLESSSYRCKAGGEPVTTGTIMLGYLRLSASKTASSSLEHQWIIDQDDLDAYICQVRKKLSACTSVLAWIDIWNRIVCQMVTPLFGPVANCMGKQHLNEVLAAIKKIHAELFTGDNGTGSSLTDQVKLMLNKIPGCPDISDAFIYLPQAFGGLGVQNPYTVLSLASEVSENPAAAMQEYLKEDLKAYKKAKEKFEVMTEPARARKLEGIYADKEKIAAAFPDGDTESFMSFEDWTKFRETSPTSQGAKLYDVYFDLLRVPEIDIEGTKYVIDEVRRVKRLQGITGSFWNMECGDRWAVQLYADECLERYGGMCLVEKDWLPLEALKVMRGDDDDDSNGVYSGSSVSDD